MKVAQLLIVTFSVLLKFAGAQNSPNSTSACQENSGYCDKCVDYLSNDGVTCIYCSTSGLCVPSTNADDYCSPSEQSHTCQTDYYTIIFVVVLCSLFCLCFGTCYWKRLRRGDSSSDGLLAPLLPEVARNFLWRNSLLTDGELEWMCIICGFDNKPRNEYCNMCGTSHSFTIEYKSEKKEEKSRARKHAKRAKQEKDEKFTEIDPIVSNQSCIEPSASLLPDASPGTPSRSILEDPSKLHQLLSSNSDASQVPLMEDLEDGGSMTWRNSVHFEDAISHPITSRLSFSSPSRHSSNAVISIAQRHEAFNYRRLNQLSLRQKSARRRKMWQRVLSPDGVLKWVRVSPQDTLVGDAQFGYTPRNSTIDRDGSECSSVNENNDRFSFLGVFGLGRPKNKASRSSQSEGSDAEEGDTQSLVHSPQSAGKVVSNPVPISGHPGKSDIASLLASRTGGRTGTLSADSFGDSVVLSGSPGFTSTFAEDGDPSSGGWGLNWERVESGANARRSIMPTAVASSGRSDARQGGTGGDARAAGGGFESSAGTNSAGRIGAAFNDSVLTFADEDLVSVAALPFKDKQLWFLEHIGKLQRPWSEGCVRLDVRRGEKLLEDSIRQFGCLSTSDLHKWMRVQFTGEPGIDAGGLEREWFTLVVQDLFSAKAGLFTCSSGDALGGTYHVNPTSGTAKCDHLACYRFAGKLFGKALMEQQVIGATLSLPLRKQILSLPITFSDLEFVDPQLHRNLRWLDTCPDLSVLCLDFTVNYPGAAGAETFELKPSGADCMVNNSNKEEYLLLRLRNRMLDSVKPQLESLLRGLYEVIPPDLLSVFDYQELELLMCGIPEINLEDWMRHTDYLSDYARLGARHKVIRWFWLCVENMTNEERVRLLQFATGCSRLPAQGFKALQSNDGNYRRFNIQG